MFTFINIEMAICLTPPKDYRFSLIKSTNHVCTYCNTLDWRNLDQIFRVFFKEKWEIILLCGIYTIIFWKLNFRTIVLTTDGFDTSFKIQIPFFSTAKYNSKQFKKKSYFWILWSLANCAKQTPVVAHRSMLSK